MNARNLGFLRVLAPALALAITGRTVLAAADPSAEPSGQAQIATPSQTLEAVVVTGSRINSGGFDTPTPVTTATAEQLQQVAPANLADALNQLPAFKGSTRTSQPSGASAASGTNGQNLLNLRGLGSQRNLVLLDGRRVVASNSVGGRDINVLPQTLISRVDVVTGGASAAYGSDAVAGVVNFILDTRFDGMKLEAQGGVSEFDDAASHKLSAAVGKHFADDHVRLIAAAEYFHQDGISNQVDNGRDWLKYPAGRFANPAANATPRQLVLPDVRSSIGTYGGLITGGPLKGTEFGPGGVPRQFDYGNVTGTSFQSGGDGASATTGLSPQQRRANVFAYLEGDVTDNLTVFAEGLYSDVSSVLDGYYGFQIGTQNQFTIFRDNAYLPAAVRDQMVVGNLQSFPLGRMDAESPPVTLEQHTLLRRVVAGFKGTLGGNWNYDGYYSFGQTNQDLTQSNFTRNRRLYAAADAVVDPSTGQVVCRSTLFGMDAGCIPLNPFGPGSISAEAQGYILGNAGKYLKLTQHVVALNASGSLGDWFSLPAGPISMAIGAEYRREAADQTVDAISAETTDVTGIRGAPAAFQGRYGGFQTFNPAPLAGHYDVKEAYLETEIPILRGLPLVERLDVNGALRHTTYSLSGSVDTWKVGVNYKPAADVRLRYTRSRDIRAPNILELFNSISQNSSNVTVNGVTTQYTGFSSGNPDLKPERADTTTYGVVYQPSWLTGLQLSVDYHDIEIKDAIDSLSAQRTVDECARGNALLCEQIQTVGTALRIYTTQLNLSVLQTSGIDFEAAYSAPALGGSLMLRALASKLDEYSTQAPGSPLLDTSGSVGQYSQPTWSGILSAEYAYGPMSVYVQERYIGSGDIDSTLVEGIDMNLNHVGAYWYTDLTLKYRPSLPSIAQDTELFLTVNNLFNRDPPAVPPTSSTFQQPTNASLYDTLGLYFTVGVRLKF